MAERCYTKSHEWALKDGDTLKIGITDYAQEELGDVVFVELPGTGDQVARGEVMGTIESVKAVSDLYAPVSGEVVDVNGELEAKPELVNEDPLGAGWMIRVAPSDASQLEEMMNEEAYTAYVAEEKDGDR